MWGTSLPDDKLAGDLGNVIGATSIGGRRSDFFTAEKLAPGNLGLLQQYLPQPDSCSAAKSDVIRSARGRGRVAGPVEAHHPPGGAPRRCAAPGR
jgi:hypothetical protein